MKRVSVLLLLLSFFVSCSKDDEYVDSIVKGDGSVEKNDDSVEKTEKKDDDAKPLDKVVLECSKEDTYYKNYMPHCRRIFMMSFTNNHEKEQKIAFYAGTGNPKYYSKEYKVPAGETVKDQYVLTYMPNGSGDAMIRYWIESEYDTYRDSLFIKPLLMILSLD